MRQVSLNILGAGRSSPTTAISSCGTDFTVSARMASTVSVTRRPPSIINLSCTIPTLSVSAIGTRTCWITSPVSISCFRKKVVMPVSVSPLITAQLIGAAPRYCGSNDACRLKVPRRGIFQTTSGNILKATTICKSAFQARKASTNASSFNLSGWRSGRSCSSAYCFTGENCTLCPRPAGLSGIVITPTILYPPSTRQRKGSTANSGVPIYTIRKSSFFIIISFNLPRNVPIPDGTS